eukprot:CAMPEP_0182566416 /NCGR_PEP_ID=MMETSP1324-20130603/7894_1 /TAXON_ID=236786 /ORGANISM="Florenciella sp., Strain RCC1587" /LENGTH=193 /DNA_ID=CAMNT_0024780215 /DNA_START=26 /DNA_END=607 /DNA_ORIENTATION=+
MTDGTNTLARHPDWVTGGTSDDTETFNSPHSIAYHEPSASLLVADRDNFRIDVLDAATGVKLSEWKNCLGNGTGPAVAPWGVRMFTEPTTGHVQAMVAVCDSPEDGGNQRIVVLDVTSPDAFETLSASTETSTDKIQCNAVAEMAVDPDICLTPHEISVDPRTGDIYVACVTVDPGPSAILRYRRTAAGATAL